MSIESIIAIVVVCISVYNAWKKTPGEARLNDAETMAKYQKLISDEVDRGLKLSQRITELEKTVVCRDDTISALEKRLETQQETIDKQAETIERLEAQLRSFGETPVTKRRRNYNSNPMGAGTEERNENLLSNKK